MIQSASFILHLKHCFYFRLSFHHHLFHICYSSQRSFPLYLSYSHIIKNHNLKKKKPSLDASWGILDYCFFIRERGRVQRRKAKWPKLIMTIHFLMKTILSIYKLNYRIKLTFLYIMVFLSLSYPLLLSKMQTL